MDRLETRLRELRGDPVGFCREFLDLEPHPGQQRWLTQANKSENALVSGNRYGKSMVAAARRIYRSLYKIGWTPAINSAMMRKNDHYRSINVAITADQARLVWAKALSMLQGPKSSWLIRTVKMTPFPCIEFVTGATFEARSTAREGVYLLGHDFDDVNFDEAAFEPHFLTVRDNVLRMRLVDRAGTLDYTSTGNGRNDFGRYFIGGLEGKEPNLYSQSGTSYENPYIDAERLQLNAGRMTEKMRRQNIEGAIVDGGDGFFERSDIDAAQSPALTDEMRMTFDNESMPATAHVMPGGKAWFDRYPSHRYVHGWDLADKADWTVGITLDTSEMPNRVVEYARFNRVGWAEVYTRIRDRHRRYGGVTRGKTIVDKTGVGDVVVEELADIKAEGFRFTAQSKDDLLANLQSMLNLREVVFPSISPLVDELTFYERADANLITDCVMALAIAALSAKRVKPQATMTFGSLSNTRR